MTLSIMSSPERALRIARFSQRHSLFYKNLYGQRRIASLRAFRLLPVVDAKHDWIKDPVLFHKYLTRPLSNAIVFRSGGTSGDPSYTVSDIPEYMREMDQFADRILTLGLTQLDRVFNLFPNGGLYSTFITSIEVLNRIGCVHFPFSSSADDQSIMASLQLMPSVLLGQPHRLVTLARTMRKQCDSVRRIFTSGEVMPAGLRNELEMKFPQSTISSFAFGTTECGNIAFPSDSGRFEVMTERIYAEVVAPDGQLQCTVGSAGRLVVTCLDRRLLPVVRFCTGDRVMIASMDGAAVTSFEFLGRESTQQQLCGKFLDFSKIAQRLHLSNRFQFQLAHTPSGALLVLLVAGQISPLALASLRAALLQALSETHQYFLESNFLNVELRLGAVSNFYVQDWSGKCPLVVDMRLQGFSRS